MGLTRVLVNNRLVPLHTFGAKIGNAAVVSLFVDLQYLCHFDSALALSVCERFTEEESKCTRLFSFCVSSFEQQPIEALGEAVRALFHFSGPNEDVHMRVNLRVERMPFPSGRLESLENFGRVSKGSLIEVPVRIVHVEPVVGGGVCEQQQALVSSVGQRLGDASEWRKVKLLVSDDLWCAVYKPQLGNVVIVVGVVQTGAIRAIHVRDLDMRPPAMMTQIPLRCFSSWTEPLSLRLGSTTGNTFFRVSLLLSCIVAQSRTSLECIHMLVTGDDDPCVVSLMDLAGSSFVATYFRCTSVSQLIHMGLSMTQRGVCMVPDLAMMASTGAGAAKKLCDYLEGPSGRAEACGTIWGVGSIIPLVSRFSIVYRVTAGGGGEEEGRGMIGDDDDIDFIRDEIILAVRHLHQHCSTMSQNTSPAASCALDGFVRASRTLRNTKQSEISIHAIGTLFTLARAHAALCLRHSVILEDALIAIWIVEESLTASTGRSVLHFSRDLKGSKCNMDIYGVDAKIRLIEFEKHLKRFLKGHNVNIEEVEEEEE